MIGSKSGIDRVVARGDFLVDCKDRDKDNRLPGQAGQAECREAKPPGDAEGGEYRDKKPPGHDEYLSGKRILPQGLQGQERLADVVDRTYLAYNSGRLREAARLLTEKMLEADVTVGMSISGALTPAGLGASCLVPLIEAGFVDWIVSTGANLYHDLHFALNCKLCAGDFRLDDTRLFAAGVVRIYDVLLSREECLLATDQRLRAILSGPAFQRTMGTAELHYLLGEQAAQAEEAAGLPHVSVLAAARRAEVPIYTSSPGDSTLGMQIGALRLSGAKLGLDPILDVNETTALFFAAKQRNRPSGALILGGGSPKNFVLQTAPQVTDILGLECKGHDYFLQLTDARPDTGGLSGATPQEAVSWGKIDPDRVPESVVAYVDTTIALPILTSYALTRRPARPLKRLYRLRGELVAELQAEYLARQTG
jgi:deoxyhypusine synthase